MGGEWTFTYDHQRQMNEHELKRYQALLLKLREDYDSTNVFTLSNMHHHSNRFEFYPQHNQLPPSHNIFGQFSYHCVKHQPPHTGWHLLWNPNAETNRSKYTSSLNNHCAPFEFQKASKRMQSELERELPNFFSLVDVYDFDFAVNFHNRVQKLMSYKSQVPDELLTRPVTNMSGDFSKEPSHSRFTDSTMTLVVSTDTSDSNSSSSNEKKTPVANRNKHKF